MAKQKIRVHDQAYCSELNQVVDVDDYLIFNDHMGEVVNDGTGGQCSSVQPELDRNMVQSIKSLREHYFNIPGMSHGTETQLEASTRLTNANDFGVEGLHMDPICNQKEFAWLKACLEVAVD